MPINPVSQMTTMEMAPGLDAYNRIPKLAATLNFITKAASYTCLPEESGSVYTATAAATFTLPAVTNTGWFAWFVNQADANAVVASAEGGNIVADGDASADSYTFSTPSHKIGGVIMIASDGTKWNVLSTGNLSAVGTVAT